jgi:hypothetical protein
MSLLFAPKRRLTLVELCSKGRSKRKIAGRVMCDGALNSHGGNGKPQCQKQACDKCRPLQDQPLPRLIIGGEGEGEGGKGDKGQL